MRPFLGRVPLRVPGSRSLGQVEFTDPWGAYHRITGRASSSPEEIPPSRSIFRGVAREMERRALHASKIQGKEQECEILTANMEDAQEPLLSTEKNLEIRNIRLTPMRWTPTTGVSIRSPLLKRNGTLRPWISERSLATNWPPGNSKSHRLRSKSNCNSAPWMFLPSTGGPSTAPHELNEWPEEIPYPTGEPVPRLSRRAHRNSATGRQR
jgi:hypothetical protein